MPSPLIAAYAKKLRVPEAQVEKAWELAKEKAKGIRRSNIIDKSYWKLVNGILKRDLGLSESTTFMTYLIEATQTSFYYKIANMNRYKNIKLPAADLDMLAKDLAEPKANSNEKTESLPKLWAEIIEYYAGTHRDNYKDVVDETMDVTSTNDMIKASYSFKIRFDKRTGWGDERKVKGELTILPRLA